MSHRLDAPARWKARTRALSIAIAAVLVTLLAPSADARVDSPTITAPVHRSVQSGVVAVHFAGTAVPGWTVDLIERDTIGYVARGIGVDQVTGEWSIDASMPAGSYVVYAIAYNGFGGATPPSTSISFQVDATAPATRIDRPEDKTIFEPGEPVTISGHAFDDTGVAAVQLEYWLLNKVVAVRVPSCTACGSGTTASWIDEPDVTTPGHYVVRARASDVAGNVSQYAVTSFIASSIEESPVERPELPGEEIEPPVIETPGEDDLIPGTEGPTRIGGDSEPGTTVEIVDLERGTIGAAVGDDTTGRWSMQARLSDGTYTIGARGIDRDGNVSPLSSTVTFTVDGFRPQLDVSNDTQTFLPGQPVVLTGAVHDERGVARVHLDYWLLNKHVLSEDARCWSCPNNHVTWTHAPDLALPGYYTVNVYAVDLAGNKSKAGSMSFVKTI